MCAGPETIDVAIPTHESGAVLGGTLERLARAEESSPVAVSRLVLVDDESDDDTREIARAAAEANGWEPVVASRPSTLPEARELAIDRVESDWFLFLDDDVRLSTSYLRDATEAVAPAVGAVQGRKGSRDEHNTDWVRRRARRGGTHATLLRRSAIEGVSYPDDLLVLEDEYTRRHVEDDGYLWVFNHRARFEHASQERHPIGWREGYLGGKYGLSQFHTVALNVPFALASGRSPAPHAGRAAGWVAGRARRGAEGIVGGSGT
jgi:glycosyltransferase involved in cell wall biosynthesis